MSLPEKTHFSADLVRDALRAHRTVTIEVSGTGMFPLIRAGDRIVVVPAGKARPGDILAVSGVNRILVSRVVRKNPWDRGSALVLKGDARTYAYPFPEPSAIVGRVSEILPVGHGVVVSRVVSMGFRVITTAIWITGRAVRFARKKLVEWIR